MSTLAFHDPAWLWLLLLLPAVLALRLLKKAPAWVVPFAGAWHHGSLSSRTRTATLLFSLACALAIIALARPQLVDENREVERDGFDIMLAIDLSGSMLAEDYSRYGVTLNRWQAIKPIIEAFIKERTHDRIGLIIFSGRAYTYAPLTFDKTWLIRQVDRLRIGLIEDGTAIGDGIGLALERLELSRAQDGGGRAGAFIVLLTDGANNRGILNPDDAANLAAARGIKVYTIGAGRPGIVPFPIFDASGRRIGTQNVESDLDEPLLQRIAQKTGGEFFRSMDIGTTEAAFRKIDANEKIRFESIVHRSVRELFSWLATPALGLAALGLFLARRQQGTLS
ncbi:MAG: VWA domain-containing protein [Verrucomicrobiia bacterium]